VLTASISSQAIVVEDQRGQDPTLPNVTSNRYAGVGYVSGGCTGVAIAPTVVLTAAHCIFSSRSSFSIPFDDAPDVSIAASTSIHPHYDGSVASPGDLALLFLDVPLPAYVPIYRLASFLQAPAGSYVELVGFGNHGTGSTGQISGTSTWLVKRWGYNEVDALKNGYKLLMDLDGGGINRLGSSGIGCTEIGIKTGQCAFRPESLTAQGDSGGPAFYSIYRDRTFNPLPDGVFEKPLSDEPFVLGITSYGSCYRSGCGQRRDFSRYGDTTSHTYVGPYLDWIRDRAPMVSAASFTSTLSPRESVSFTETGELWEGPDPDPVPEAGGGLAAMASVLALGFLGRSRLGSTAASDGC
jgi:hypothetical protein